MNVFSLFFLISVILSYFGNESISYVSTILLGSFYAFAFHFRNRKPFFSTKKYILCAFIIVITTSTIINIGARYTEIPLKSIKWLYLGPFFLVVGYSGFLFYQQHGAHGLEKALTFILNFFFLPLCVLGCFEFFKQANPLMDFFPPQISYMEGAQLSATYRVSSMFLHPIVFADLLLFFFWINIFYVKTKWLKLSVGVLIIVDMFGTQTRAIWLMFVLSIFVFFCMEKKWKLWLKGLSFLLVGLFFLLKNLDVISERLSTLGEGASFYQRYYSIGYVVHAFFFDSNIFQKLFGFGFGESSKFIAQHFIMLENFATVDNQFVSLLYEFGFLPCSVLFAWIVFFIKTLKDSRILFLFVLLLSMFFFANLLYWSAFSVVFFFLVGAWIAAWRSPSDFGQWRT